MPARRRLTVLAFFVAGRAVSQGRLNARPGSGVLFHDTKGLKQWRRTVTTEARRAAVAAGWLRRHSGPVELRVHFELPRGSTVKRAHPSVRPDLDKLLRAIGDSLTGVLYDDDAQVVSVVATKSYAGDSEPGAFVVVREVL